MQILPYSDAARQVLRRRFVLKLGDEMVMWWCGDVVRWWSSEWVKERYDDVTVVERSRNEVVIIAKN